MTTVDELLACPRCAQKAPAPTDDGYRCAGCKTTFRSQDGIPWLFAEPDAALAEWRQRLKLAVQQLAHDEQRIGQELKKSDLLDTTKKRLTHLQAQSALQRKALLAITAPLDPGSLTASYESRLALRTRLPGDQGLNTYYNNLHRDWVWGDEENAATLERIAAVTSDAPIAGDVLVLGAGGGRLAYDLHESRDAGRTVALDFNPLLLFVARRMYAGDSLELTEFPLAPATLEDVAVTQSLASPGPARDGLVPVLGDVLRAPFAGQSFDVVVTPWLIDIVSEDLRNFAPRINALLKDGGRWITFGSLAFEHASRARRYAPVEVQAIAENSGFDTTAVDEATIPYMCSPHSRHGRRERVYTAAWTKTKRVKAPDKHKALPDWLVTGKAPVPATRSFQTQAMSTRIYAYVMSLIDGRRSIEDMALMMEREKLMPREEAVSAIRNFFIRMYEDSQRNPNF